MPLLSVAVVVIGLVIVAMLILNKITKNTSFGKLLNRKIVSNPFLMLATLLLIVDFTTTVVLEWGDELSLIAWIGIITQAVVLTTAATNIAQSRMVIRHQQEANRLNALPCILLREYDISGSTIILPASTKSRYSRSKQKFAFECVSKLRHLI
jgi:CDP-diglyceride synthetase